MGLFDKFKKKKNDSEVVEENAPETAAEVTEEEFPRASLLDRLSGGEPIFTDHESDIAFQEEYEARQKEESFYKLKEGLKKTKDGFVSRMETLINSFTKIDEDFFEELEETLILSDIGAETSADICDKLRAAVKKTGTTEPESVKQLLKDIISEILTGDNALKLESKPSVIMVIGVNGAGKTTTIGKMAANFKNAGKKVIVAAADTFRAAAIDQLNVWAERADVEIVKHSEGSDPAAVIFDAISAAKARGADIVLCDTAGRLHNKKNLMEELKKIARVIARELPDASVETLLVLDATTGQNAVNQARLFSESADITGIVLTKLDGTAKGGIIIPIKNELNLSVKLVGVGEQIDDLQPFVPEDYVNALFE
ncbi:MAG: signal recognition particle-docking protein FtsY [Ruminococcaceae bacterium]|nr:signal recognition particle-docking protein FtsY [Oscillospiraceae bacterium]